MTRRGLSKAGLVFIMLVAIALPLPVLALAQAVQTSAVAGPSAPLLDASGKINYWLLAGVVGIALWTNVVMVLLKRFAPGWQTKAWAPPVIAGVTFLLTGLASGQVSDLHSLLGYLLGGAGIGGGASSLRDVVVGK